EVGAFDYGPGTPYKHAHTAAPTPSGDWVYVDDELADGDAPGGGVHVFDTHTCDGTSYCTPTMTGFYHAAGSPVVNDFDPYNFVSWDAHRMTPKGENTFALGNYGFGVKLVDTRDKAHPKELASYVPSIGVYGGPLAWGAIIGPDGLVYASDISNGFLIL